ncbi:hypothetical protein [Petropleomorpha daqingensis]|uniref:O-antigen ligase like membrane protein n=1 Tax=Petropleomorpha daqingensis TaxID=2026353 RepID=A0A853CFT8_9ACTN|nr:hypothetical protein [Petropleomorpha daqingensis]NYJ05859.1 hypothetical protein [Petropleomorpha daqingensis]
MRISRIAQGVIPDYGDRSYASVAAIYSALGIEKSLLTASFLGYGLFLLALTEAVRRYRHGHLTWSTTIVAAAGCILGAVYLGFYSKDIVVAVIALAVIALPSNPAGNVTLALIFVGYALTFRSYWFLILAISIGLIVLRRRLRTPARMLLLLVAVLVTASLIYASLYGVDIRDVRDAINADRLGSADAQSAISSFLTGGGVAGGAINACLELLFLVAPIPLALTGGPLYAGIAVLLAAFWMTVFLAVRKLGRTPSADPRLWRASAVLLACVVVQSLFEPDYGSALRHLTPFLPVALFLLHGASTITALRANQQPAARSRVYIRGAV